jgi:hypothetical protein
MPDTTVNSELNRITQYVKLSILMNLFETFRIKWKAGEGASRKGRGLVTCYHYLGRKGRGEPIELCLIQIEIEILSSTPSSPSRTVTTTTLMSALRILVPVKRVIDYAVRLHFSLPVQLIVLPIPDLTALFHSSPLPARKPESSQASTRWSDGVLFRGWVADREGGRRRRN